MCYSLTIYYIQERVRLIFSYQPILELNNFRIEIIALLLEFSMNAKLD